MEDRSDHILSILVDHFPDHPIEKLYNISLETVSPSEAIERVLAEPDEIVAKLAEFFPSMPLERLVQVQSEHPHKELLDLVEILLHGKSTKWKRHFQTIHLANAPKVPTNVFSLEAIFDCVEDGRKPADIRREINALQEARNEFYKKAAQSYREKNSTGRGCTVYYSNEGAVLQNKIEGLKRLYALTTFKRFNSDTVEDVIDLHGLGADEAVQVLYAFLETRKGGPVTVITGAGNHSRGQAILRPAVQRFLNAHSYKYTFDGNAAFYIKT